MKVFTAQQMRDFDKAATEEYGIPSIVLMENAALRVVEFLEMKFAPLYNKRIVVLCGKGNNGGDGFAIARHLLSAARSVTVIFAGTSNQLKGDAQANFQILQQLKESSPYKLEIIRASNGVNGVMDVNWSRHDFIVDALLGTGFTGEVRGARLQAALEWTRIALIPVVAVDIPSALESDSGRAAELSLHANYTVTFAAPKRGMFLRDGLEACGEIWIGAIGTSVAQMDATVTGCLYISRLYAFALGSGFLRSLDAHKGDAGRVLLIGGSYGMSGAPTLAARATLKVGAGTCVAALPDKIISSFAAAFCEATSHPLPCDEKGVLIESAVDELPALWEKVNAVALGPGIGRDASTLALVQRVVKECPQPLIMDADALYALRDIEKDVNNREAPTILTPHPGEMAELMETSTQDVQENRIETAIACAQKYNAIVVLKGARSVVATPDGNTYINLTGNAGMATGGSGDVLTGTIAGLLAQTKDALSATLLGVYTHGLAGDLAFETLGNGLIAGDIADHLPRALLEIQKPLEPPVNARLRPLR